MRVRHLSALSTATLLILGGGSAHAAVYGTVVSSTPVYASLAVPLQQCVEEPVVQPARTGGGGAIAGAIFGAALGNMIGHGSGRAVATGLGMIAGAAIGDHAEAQAAPPVTGSVQRCRTVSRTESRIVGYDVIYDYDGMRRSVRLANDPGPRIALDVAVTPIDGVAPTWRGSVPPPVSAPVYRSPADLQGDDDLVIAPAPARMVYAPQPVVAVNPWPYVAAGAVVGAVGYSVYRGHPGRHAHWHEYRR